MNSRGQRCSAVSCRCLTGLALGAGLGLSYGLVSQMINRVVLPGVPFYQPPFGPLGNVGLCTFGGALLGLVTAWPSGSIAGVFLSSALSAVLILIATFVEARPSREVLTVLAVTSVFLALPFWAMLVPMTAALRWGINGLEEARQENASWGVWARRPLVLLLLVGIVGAFSLYRPQGRHLLARMNTLLQDGMRARDGSALPPALLDARVGSFVQQAHGPYTLQWESRDIERFRIPRPAGNLDEHTVVIARFKSGWQLVCLFPSAEADPICKGF